MNKTDPRLYILMRTDMESMNAGKAMAQAAHAANAFVDKARGSAVDISDWTRQTKQAFGTTITLAVPSEDEMTKTVLIADAMGYLADVIHDPTYPVRDGYVTHLLPINTCAYVFSPNGSPWFLSSLSLHT